MLPSFSCRKTGSGYQAIKVNALFGDKKDNSEKGDEAPSKVLHSEHCDSNITINSLYFSYIHGSP